MHFISLTRTERALLAKNMWYILSGQKYYNN